MDSFDYAQLTYLILLGLALAVWFFVEQRKNLGRSAKHAVAWGMIFVGVIAAVGLWEDIRQTVSPQQSAVLEEGRITLPRAPDGHYYATLDVNGTPTRFVVDTGATSVVLTQADAAAAGINLSDLVFLSEARTANGVVRTAPVTLSEVSIGPFTDQSVRAVVNQGEMSQSLLGMTYLQRYDKIEISQGELILTR